MRVQIIFIFIILLLQAPPGNFSKLTSQTSELPFEIISPVDGAYYNTSEIPFVINASVNATLRVYTENVEIYRGNITAGIVEFTRTFVDGFWTVFFNFSSINGTNASILMKVSFIVDTVPPKINIYSPVNGSEVASPTIPLVFEIADLTFAYVLIFLNGILLANLTRIISLEVPLVIGLNNITIVARDKAGHVSVARIYITRVEKQEERKPDLLPLIITAIIVLIILAIAGYGLLSRRTTLFP